MKDKSNLLLCSKKNKKYLEELDFVRAVSAIGIIVCHFGGELYNYRIESELRLLYTYNNGGWGWLLVTVFFVLSGSVLRIQYASLNANDVFNFYKKRWISIFPAFYILWLFLHIQKASVNGSLLYNGNSVTLLFTLFGVDGYLSYKIPNYALIGEWFLGAIVIIYLIYPFLLKIYNTNKWLLGVALIIALEIEIRYNLSISTGPFRNITSCVLSFYLGMLYIDYRNSLYKYLEWTLVVSAIMCLLFFCAGSAIPISAVWQVHILGFFFFLILCFIGYQVMNIKMVSRIMRWLSKISYHIFLVQHVAINEILGIFRGRIFGVGMYIVILAVTIVWTIILSYVLLMVTAEGIKCVQHLKNHIAVKYS